MTYFIETKPVTSQTRVFQFPIWMYLTCLLTTILFFATIIQILRHSTCTKTQSKNIRRKPEEVEMKELSNREDDDVTTTRAYDEAYLRRQATFTSFFR